MTEEKEAQKKEAKIEKNKRKLEKKKQKSFRKLKKNRSWVTILFFLIVSIVASALFMVYVESFMFYAIETKIGAEYKSIAYMARLYEENYMDGNNVFNLLNAEGRDYYITDDKGKLIYQKGENTRSDKGGVVYLSSVAETDGVMFYTDTENDSLYVKGGNLKLDFKQFIKSITFGKGNNIVFKSEDGDYVTVIASGSENENEGVKFSVNQSYDEYYDDEVIELSEDMDAAKEMHDAVTVTTRNNPIWVEIKLNGGKEILYAKAFFSVDIKDLILFVSFALMVAVLALVIFIIVVVNIVSNFVRQRRITNYFFTDHVTRGHNWMWFKVKGDQLLRKKSNARNKYAIINIGFVKFRAFCMCHSIEEGEAVLRRVSDWITASIDKKEMLAHVSSSNFALLLKYNDADELDERIRTLIKELEQIDTEHKFAFQLGVNKIGVSKDANGLYVKRKGFAIDSEYNNACTARATMSDSEDSGVAYFDEKLVDDQRWIDQVQEKQQSALDNEEFVVYYQPKYDPRTNELRGAEALIRWQSPDFGFVPPGKIIPIFEKNGFVTEIDHYMITHVARDQKAWLDKGYKCVPVSVNVSRAHFIESDLAEQIRDMVDKEGAPHNLIEIELTESAFFDDKNAMIETIEKLKSYGFAVSMDDFGSGYSSLNSLKDMPLDVLKLDAEFFRGENRGERGEIVVSEAIRLAKSLNMRTVAEGVEVKEQVEFLAGQGCDMIQGYYFAKPMPKNDYEERMKAGKKTEDME
ncbi:MAG: GGDEF domain-containing protein [Lachnospiraceae bacterium]|nr:GGDEF domain-containing protein [Lachnospiraceae bacterium]